MNGEICHGAESKEHGHENGQLCHDGEHILKKKNQFEINLLFAILATVWYFFGVGGGSYIYQTGKVFL